MNKTLKPENFVYWLQGFFEISEAKTLTEEQVIIVKEHLELCFDKTVPAAEIEAKVRSGTLADYLKGLKDSDTGTLIC